jgi:hypothetical protein
VHRPTCREAVAVPERPGPGQGFTDQGVGPRPE